MIRIITGKLKGRLLNVPEGTKPLTDRIKTSLFDLMRDYFTPEAVVLDMFSGSGNFAIEALSRGAGRAVMVDSGEKQYVVITKNINSLGIKKQCELRKQDAFNYLESATELFDIIMLDPPFPFSPEAKERLRDMSLKLLNKDGILIFRYPKTENYPLKKKESRAEIHHEDYGLSQVSFYRKF